MAHSDGGALVDGDSRLTAEQVAVRMGLPVVSAGPDGPSVSPPKPVTVIMLVCDVAGRVGAPPPVSSPAGDLHRVTGQRIVAPVGRAIMLPNGEVIAGTWHVGAPDSEAVPVESGDWVVWENGEARSLDTPYLSEALDRLGVVLGPPAGLPPAVPVDFYNGLTGPQEAALDDQGYAVTLAVRIRLLRTPPVRSPPGGHLQCGHAGQRVQLLPGTDRRGGEQPAGSPRRGDARGVPPDGRGGVREGHPPA